MFPGLDALGLGRLRMSVGYGRAKTLRPFSPVEVAEHLDRARREGFSAQDCAELIGIDVTGVGRFLRLLELPEEIRHLVDWGSRTGFIAFSAATELLRLPSNEDRRRLAHEAVRTKLNSKELRQVAQLRIRSGRAIRECVDEVVGMRPTYKVIHVFVGSLVEPSLQQRLADMSQVARDGILEGALRSADLDGIGGRLGKRFFTLVGDERFGEVMKKRGKRRLESTLRDYIDQAATQG